MLLKAFTFSFGEVMKNSLLPTLHTYLQHDENMGLKLLLCKHCLWRKKNKESFNIHTPSTIRNRAGYLLHLVFLHLYLSSYLIPLILTVLETDFLFCHIKWERFARRNLTNTFPLLPNREAGLSQNTTMNWENTQYCLPVRPSPNLC